MSNQKTEKLKNFFLTRKLKFIIYGGQKADGTPFVVGNNETNSVELEDYQSQVTINIYGAYVFPSAEIKITNVPENLANVLSTVGFFSELNTITTNQISVQAALKNQTNNEIITYTEIFHGSILVSYMDYNSDPDPVLTIEAQTLGGYNIIGAPPTSFQGKVEIPTLVDKIIANYKSSLDDASLFPCKGIKNYGVTGSISNPNYAGSLVNQLTTCSGDNRFNMSFYNRYIYLYPYNPPIIQKNDPWSIAKFTKQNGLIGYPSSSGNNISLKSFFRPEIIYGQPIEIVSTFLPANGIWRGMLSLKHELTCKIPDGAWFTNILLSRQNIKGAFANV